jgi:hypothetical protein
MPGSRHDGWTVCPAGEIEQLSLRLRLRRRAEYLVNAVIAAIAAVALVAALYVTGSALIAELPVRDAGAASPPPARHRVPPTPKDGLGLPHVAPR